MSNRNLEGQDFILNIILFGVPQNRRRYFAVYLSTSSPIIDFSRRTLFDQFATIHAFLSCCRRQFPPLEEVLLESDSKHLAEELERRLALRGARPSSSPTWVPEHQKEYNKLRLVWGIPSPCQATRQSPWLQTLTRSQHSILVLHQSRLITAITQLRTAGAKSFAGQASNSTVADQTKSRKLLIDMNPSIGRFCGSLVDDCSGLQIAPCVLPQQLLWAHLPTPRCLIGIEAMLLQGWPVLQVLDADELGGLPDFISDKMLQSLAGNAVSPPMLLALLIFSCLGISWIAPGSDSETDEELEVALKLVAEVTS
jgi:site-specific DNA-cytosine methylase